MSWATPGRRLAAGWVALAVVASLLAGCGSVAESLPGDRIQGRVLTVYSSLPLTGVSSASGHAALAGERLALARAGARIGRYRIVLRSLDDATVASGQWDPGQTTVDADLALQDPTTIGYIGELDSGASAISIPLLNRLGIAQISPWSSAVGLTVNAPGAAPGEPQKYYPSGVRTFARVVPDDEATAAAIVKLQERLGCRQVFVLHDGEVDGEDLAATFELVARDSTLKVVAIQTFSPSAGNYDALAQSVAQTGANCVLIDAIAGPPAALLSRQIAAALPRAMIFGSPQLAQASYVDPARGGIPQTLDSRVMVVAAVARPPVASADAAAFYAGYHRCCGDPPPDAIFAYEAMNLMLSAIERASDHGRQAAERSRVRAAIFATRDRASVLGTYSIDANGDTDLARFGVFQAVDGRLRMWTAVAS